MEDLKSAKEEALSFLDRKDRTVFEVEQHLVEKGWSDNTIDGVISFLKDKRILNDKRFVEFYAMTAFDQGKSKTRVKEVLVNRGILEEEIDAIIEQLATTEREEERGKCEIEKILKREGLTKKSLRKIFTRLAYLGYSESFVFELCQPLLEKLENNELF